MKKQLFGAVFVGLFLTGCGLSDPRDSVSLSIQLPTPATSQPLSPGMTPNLTQNAGLDLFATNVPTTSATLPTTVDGFNCYSVNVYGPGIPGDLTGDGSTTIPPANCSYLGIGSDLITPPNNIATVKVPSGPSRSIQVIGIAVSGGCPNSSLRDYLKTLKTNFGTGALPVAMLEIGKKTVDLFKDTDVEIQNTYTGPTTAAGTFPFRCTGTTTPGVVLPLTAGFSGSVGQITAGLDPFGDTLTTVLPPGQGTTPHPNVSPMPATGLTLLQNAFNSSTPVYATTTTGNHYARLDLVYDVGSVNLSNFSSLKVEAKLTGGLSVNSNPGCNSPGTLTSGLGAEIRVWDPVAGTWAGSSGTATNSTLSMTTVTFSTAGFRTPSRLAFAETGTPAGTYIHISIRSLSLANGGPPTPCSTIGVQSVKVSLEP